VWFELCCIWLLSFSNRLFLVFGSVGGGVASRDMKPRLRPDAVLLGVQFIVVPLIVALLVLFPFFAVGDGSGVIKSTVAVGVTFGLTFNGFSSRGLPGCPYDGRLRRFAPRSDPASDGFVGLPSRDPCDGLVGRILGSACSCLSDSFESLVLSDLAIGMAAENRCRKKEAGRRVAVEERVWGRHKNV
jgi:hypothetical protein